MEESLLNNLSDDELSELVTKSQKILNGRRKMTFNKDVYALIETIRKFSAKYPKARLVVDTTDILDVINTCGFNDLLEYFYLDD